MRNFLRRLTLVAVVAAACSAAPARAQFVNPYGYGYPYGYPDPYGGYLRGAASVIDSQGQLMLNTQQTYLQQQKVKQSKIDTKRKAFDEWKYEQANTPTLEEERARIRAEQLRRSQNDPPAPEIWSGKALNDLLKDVQRLQVSGAYAPSVTLDQETLRHVNVSSGVGSGSVGLLRDDGKLQWPLPLQDELYDADRKQIDDLMVKAVQQARSGAVEAKTLRGLIAAVKKATDKLRANINNTPSTQYISAKRYLTQLEDSTKILQDPNVANYFGRWQARGNTVAELVTNMAQQGLSFAPATQGDEPYYTALHHAMASYDTALAQLARRDMAAMNTAPPPGGGRAQQPSPPGR